MSILKPHKLGVIAGPGSEYFTGKVVKHLRRLYISRYEKVSEALTKRHGITGEELLKTVTLLDDLDSKKIPTGKLPTSFHCPDFTINVKYTRFSNGEENAEIIDPVRGLNV
ncbi:MAG: ribose-phosphate pyrophosphokinase, partial [Candidatus Ornithospirochaeta sp.]